MKSSSVAEGAPALSALLASTFFASAAPPVLPAEPEDQDTGDVSAPAVDEDALEQDDLDTDRVTSPD